MATIEMLEGDYVKEALETDKLLDECLHRCNLERQLGKQVRMLGALEPRKRADEIEEKADGKLGEFTPIATTCVAYVFRLGAARKRPKNDAREQTRGAAGVAQFFKRNVGHKWKLTLFKALVQGALTSAGETRCYSESDLKKIGVQTMHAGATNLGEKRIWQDQGRESEGRE